MKTAADIMTTKLVLLHPADKVPQIAAKLSEHHISAAPVVDAEGKVLGMVSEGDLIGPLSAKASSRRAWWLEMLAEGEDLSQDYLNYVKQEARTAAEVMKRNVVSVEEQTPVEEIVDLIIGHNIKRVPVLRDGKIIGIVSRADIIGTLSSAGG